MKKIIKKVVSFLLRFLYVFPIQNNKIFIYSFGGSDLYGFDGKAIVEYSNNNKLGYNFIWGLTHKSNLKRKKIKYVKLTSLSGIYHIMTSGVFITNINPPSYIPFRKRQILINTWHGLPMKTFGKYNPSYDLNQINMSTCFISHSKQYTEIALKDAFDFKGDILNCGAPRNDVLFDKNELNDRSNLVRMKYNISCDDFVVLYAPTFRGNFVSSNYSFDYERISKTIEKKYNKKVVFLARLHPMIVNKERLEGQNVIDVSNYEDIQDLYCIADLLITDYSSTSFDFCLTGKPVLLHLFDFNEYKCGRGLSKLFFDRPYPISQTIDELIKNIEEFNSRKYRNELNNYFKKIVLYEKGHACECIYKYIEDRRNGNEKK